MPPKSRPQGPADSGSGSRSKRRRVLDKGSEEYLIRRERNNVAVKKSREKSRAKAKGTVEKVARLKEENASLEQQVTILSKELGVLKDLFKMAHAGTDQDSAVCDISSLGDIKPEVLSDEGNSSSTSGKKVKSTARKHFLSDEVGETCVENILQNAIITEVNKDALQKDHEYLATKR